MRRKEKEKEKERFKDVENEEKVLAPRNGVEARSSGTGSSRAESSESGRPKPLGDTSNNFNALLIDQQRHQHLQESSQIQSQNQQRQLSSMTQVSGFCDSLADGAYPFLEAAFSDSVGEECPTACEPLALFSTEESQLRSLKGDVGKDVTHALEVIRQGSDVNVNEGGELGKPAHGLACLMLPPTSIIPRYFASSPAHINPIYSSSSFSFAAPVLDPILVAKALSKVPPFARAGLKKRMEQQQQQKQQQMQRTVTCPGAAEGASESRSCDPCKYQAESFSSLPLDQEERREMLGSQWEMHRQKVRPWRHSRENSILVKNKTRGWYKLHGIRFMNVAYF